MCKKVAYNQYWKAKRACTVLHQKKGIFFKVYWCRECKSFHLTCATPADRIKKLLNLSMK